MNLVSIIVPVYNTSKYLPQCLDSLMAQTYSDFEAICVNDGSTDNSVKILQDYMLQDKRIKFVNKVNGGTSSARNLGIAKARGKYICFLDADDYVHPQFLEIMLQEIKDKKICCCAYTDVDDEYIPDFKTINKYSTNIAQSLEYFASCKDQQLTAWGKLYSADIFQSFKFDENCYFSEDVLFHSDAFADNFKINIISAPLVYYRNNPQSLIHKKSSAKKINSLLLVAEYISNKYRNNPLWKEIYKNRVAKAVANALKYLDKCDNKKQVYPNIKMLYKQGIIKFSGLSFSKKLKLIKIIFLGVN